jgi:pimeloyl-ACP methyl ester carboxylesterase
MSKQRILLLHGALGSHNSFNDLMPLLSKTFEVHAIDFHGHGTLANDKQLSTELLCSQVIDYVLIHSLAPLPIFGYSMGGYIALMASIKRPDLFGNIITLATKYEWDDAIAAREILQLNTIKELSNEHPFKMQLEYLHGQYHVNNCIKLTGELILELVKNKPLNERTFLQIKNQVLLLVGDQDKMVSIEETTFAQKHLSNSKMIILHNTKHPLEKVNANELISIIEQFIH